VIVKQLYSPRWDLAIADATKKLERTENAVSGLKRAISNLKRLRDSGQPWPGEKNAATQN
jgi:hypothetical protein